MLWDKSASSERDKNHRHTAPLFYVMNTYTDAMLPAQFLPAPQYWPFVPLSAPLGSHRSA